MVIAATMGYPWLDLFRRFPTLVHTLHMLTRTATSRVARQKATVGYPQLVWRTPLKMITVYHPMQTQIVKSLWLSLTFMKMRL